MSLIWMVTVRQLGYTGIRNTHAFSEHGNFVRLFTLVCLRFDTAWARNDERGPQQNRTPIITRVHQTQHLRNEYERRRSKESISSEETAKW